MAKRILRPIFNVVFGYIGLMIFFYLVGMVVTYFSTRPVELKPASYVVVDFNQPIVDSPLALEENLFASEKTHTVRQLVEIIHAAAADPMIGGVVLQGTPSLDLGWASAQELRQALDAFKEAAPSKNILAFSSALDERGLYLFSVADSLALHPQGELTLNGLGAQIPFFKKALDALGINVVTFQRGDYKSFAEPFVRENLSEPNREQLSAIVDSIWGEFVATLADARHVAPESINTIAQTVGLLGAQDAVDAHLADSIAFWDEFKSQNNLTTDLLVDTHSYMRNVNATLPDTISHIALVYFSGPITFDENYTRTIQTLRDLRRDGNVRGLVFRVDSPGGAVVPSANIARELSLIKETLDIPVVVSMANSAASGGYWISAPADTIFADSLTLTGSIGVIGMLPDATVAASHLNVSFDTLATSPLATIGSPFVSLSDVSRQSLEAALDRTYDAFLAHVQSSRGLSDDALAAATNARVWTGAAAVDVGLVDRVGSLHDAIKFVEAEIGLGELSVEYFPKPDRLAKLKHLFDGTSDSVWGAHLAPWKSAVTSFEKSGPLWALSPLSLFPIR